MRVRVLIAEDHRMVAEGLRILLADQTDVEVLGIAPDGRAALEMARQLQPDVVLMDMTMPGLNGADATREICRYLDDTRVCALSMHTGRSPVTDMLDAGASGYVVKNASIEEILTAVRAIAEGGLYFSSEIMESVPDLATKNSRDLKSYSPRGLSTVDRQVLQLVAEGKSSKEIAPVLHVTKKTVDYHRQSIMNKLDLRTVADLTKFAIRQGLTPL